MWGEQILTSSIILIILTLNSRTARIIRQNENIEQFYFSNFFVKSKIFHYLQRTGTKIQPPSKKSPGIFATQTASQTLQKIFPLATASPSLYNIYDENSNPRPERRDSPPRKIIWRRHSLRGRSSFQHRNGGIPAVFDRSVISGTNTRSHISAHRKLRSGK